MKLDKELYRQAREWYRQWNEAERIEQARNAGQRSPQQAWRAYVGLWEFCMLLSGGQSERQRRQRLTDWDRYYARIRQLEEWRRQRGTTA